MKQACKQGVTLPFALPPVLACGAWLKNAACLLGPDTLTWSALNGDLGDPGACLALELSVQALLRGASQQPVAIAHDLHPDFYSTRLALALAQELGIPAIGVQHHHAHIAAVMAEHAVQEPVIGLALDGVGLGTDGQSWGGELLWVDTHGWQRLGHLWPLALPGGDVAAREPWRMAASVMHSLGRTEEITPRFAPAVGHTAAHTVQHMLARQFNCPASSSAGRWFDAAAGALALSVRQVHEAQAAIALEQSAKAWLSSHALPVVWHGVDTQTLAQLDIRPLLAALLHTPPEGFAEVSAAAAWFHLALADALSDWAVLAAHSTGTSTVCLGGGCFMNAVLTQRVTTNLQQRGLRVLRPQTASCGDAGLALGQAWVAANQMANRRGASAPVSLNQIPNQPVTESLLCV